MILCILKINKSLINFKTKLNLILCLKNINIVYYF